MSLTHRLWLAFVLMAMLSLTSALIGWAGFRHIKQIEQQSTVNLLPTMKTAFQLNEAGAYILFSGQALNEVTSEDERQAQGKILTTQSIRIRSLLSQLQDSGFDTSKIKQQELRLSEHLSTQGALVENRLVADRQFSDIHDRIALAANQITVLSKSQVSNAGTAVSANIATIYDDVEKNNHKAVENALDRLVEVDLDHQSRMTELHEQSLIVANLLSQAVNTVSEEKLSEIETHFGQLVTIVKRRIQLVEDPHRRSLLLPLLTDLESYYGLFEYKRESMDIQRRLSLSGQYSLLLFSQFNSELDALVRQVNAQSQQDLEQISVARDTSQNLLVVMSILSLVALLFILWWIVWRSVAKPLTMQTEALERILDGDLQTPLPQTISASELKTIGSLVERFRTNTLSLHHQQRHLEMLVAQRTEQLNELVQQHTLARQDAEMANKAKSTFLATMSHEIRTPLNGILGTAELLLLKPLSDEDRSAIEVINGSGENLLSILNDILDYSSIETGKVVISSSAFAPDLLIQQAYQLMSSAAHKKGLTLRVEQDPALPDYLNADRQRVWQIVCNLVSNAIKFTDSGSITLSSRKKENRWQISVSDTGIGIAAEQQNTLFQPFTQLTHRRGGTGLGLTICRRLSQAMNGELSFSSQYGKGSCFTLCLPLEPAIKPLGISQPVLQPIEQFAGSHLLLIEDNLINQRVTTALLHQLKVQVTVASTATEAIDLLSNSLPRFDMALVDLDLPDMDGCELATRLKDLVPDLPLTAFSAHLLSHLPQRCYQSGFIGFLSKPLRLSELTEYLSAHLTGEKAISVNETLNTKQLQEDLQLFGPVKLSQWLSLYRENNLPLIETLKSAHRAGDTEKVRTLAHQLKSSSESLCLSALAHYFRDIEQTRWLDEAMLDSLVLNGLNSIDKALKRG
ncbi:TMAO reductase system sensor histidine kinase/response regulator TorS [Budvicia diplopodorum]|uniref:TMAO reductase system sensor histidine kinase/response regulator TorS n=1 Tax=Budvicia diplopodorum TaxID=1119056 RepID=UPI00135B5CA5|nr:TMAO reductase system sensor histidine kinase/response regulator TorS [Budvicia diplopodorum]